MRNNKSKLLITVLCAGIFSLGFIATANAALESRLSGHAYYDTDLNITWAADANINGEHSWFDQMAWVSGLTIDGVSGWRLPEISEMSYLYNIEGISSSLPSPFSNVQEVRYWSGTEINSSEAWGFHFNFGNQHERNKLDNLTAWAVHSGDVLSAVPEPETYAMMLVGLGLLGFKVRCRKENV